jgi:hypothetical protein
VHLDLLLEQVKRRQADHGQWKHVDEIHPVQKFVGRHIPDGEQTQANDRRENNDDGLDGKQNMDRLDSAWRSALLLVRCVYYTTSRNITLRAGSSRK